MSPFSAREAEELGHTSVKVLSTGIPGWKKAKGLVASEPNGLKKMIHEEASYVLVDLRSKEAATAGHITGAVSIPASDLAAAKDSFPKDKSAPVILYNDDQASAEFAQLVSSWGYKNTTVLNGGAKAWDGKFFPGDPGSKIVYVKKLKPGTITIAEFKQIAADRPANKIILDVRDAGTEGHIPGDLDIPQGQLDTKLAEIPTDKEIIVHCNTGILASMAFNTLKENGYNVRYVDAVVQIASNGTLEVSPK